MSLKIFAFINIYINIFIYIKVVFARFGSFGILVADLSAALLAVFLIRRTAVFGTYYPARETYDKSLGNCGKTCWYCIRHAVIHEGIVNFQPKFGRQFFDTVNNGWVNNETVFI